VAKAIEQLALRGVPRQGDEPSEHVGRIVSMLIRLMRETFLSYDW